MQYIPDKIQVLHYERPINTELVVDDLDLRWSGILPKKDICGIARDRMNN
jgi:hypothetical protein